MSVPASPLVSADWLAAQLDDPALRIADLRWYLGGKRGADEYARGHLPGAVFVDLDRDLAAPTGPGRHPLPSAEGFARFLSRIGVEAHTTVVAYDDAGGAIAARLWWLLRYFGHGGGRVLDGVPAAIDCLPAIVKCVAGRIPLLFDSGIRNGRDAYKALQLGASAVLIGRPAIWGLASAGALGVAHVIRLLRDELEATMALCGCKTLADIPATI